MWFRGAAMIGLTLSLLLGGAHAQIRSVSQKTEVRVVSESWASTQTTPASRGPNLTVIPAPLHWKDFTQPQAAVATSRTQAQSLSSAISTQSLVGLSFPGPSDSVPPDSQIAAGPNHLVAAVTAVGGEMAAREPGRAGDDRLHARAPTRCSTSPWPLEAELSCSDGGAASPSDGLMQMHCRGSERPAPMV